MLHFLPHSARRRSSTIRGMTLVETVMSVAILSLFLSFGHGTLLLANRNAMVHRLYTLAEEMARDQIDAIESAAPYNPQFAAPLGPQVPAVLTLDSARGGPLVETLPLYVDPKSTTTVINAQRTTSVTDAGSMNVRAATVTVTYTFGKRSYQVQMNTLRTSDS